MEELFTEYQSNLTHFFERMDPAAAQTAFKILASCRGITAFTGVGKSGHIAEKICKTFCSTGTPSVYLTAGDALHGDLGLLKRGDLLVVLSKSGETHELIELASYAKGKGIQTVAWVSKEQSRLGTLCNHEVILPVKKELCPFGLAPTTSTTSQLIFGDIMAIALMRQKRFSKEDFLINHPLGNLGKRLLVQVKDLMLQGNEIPTCHVDDTLKMSLVELTRKRCGCLCVLNQQGEMVGIFTDGDLRRALQTDSLPRPAPYPSQSKGRSSSSVCENCELMQRPMCDLMTSDFLWTAPHTLASKALHLMQRSSEKQVMVLPVIDQSRLVGLIRMHDIVNEGID